MATLQQRAAEAFERNSPAIEYQGRWHDWTELAVLARSLWAALDASGIDPQAPVAFAPRNRPSSVAALLALLATGRTIRMVYAFQSSAGIARDIRERQAGVAIIDADDLTSELSAMLDATGMAAIALSETGAQLVAVAKGQPDLRLADEPAIEILTSGTTGPPKSFALSYATIERHFFKFLPLPDGVRPEQVPPFLLFFPIGNISGIYSTVPTLIRGQRCVLLDRFTIGAWHDYVLRYRPSHSGIPPSMMQQLLEADIPAGDLSSIKAMGIGAAPLDPTVHRAFEARYGIPILLSYGATEFAGPVTAMTADLVRQWGEAKFGSVGRAMPGAELRIVDPDSGEPLPAGSEGLLEVISPRLDAKWIRTADLGMIDADGFLFLRGRADGAIMRGAFKIIPELVERALMEHPAVAEAAVVGIADNRLGEVPAAAVRIKPNAAQPDQKLLEQHLRDRLLAPQIPTKWRFCVDLPRTPSHKIDRPAVRRMLTES